MRTLVGTLVTTLVMAVLAITPRAEAVPDVPYGARADGNSYSILWVLPEERHPVAVRIAGRRAELTGGGYWEVVLTGPWRRLDVREVVIRSKGGRWAGPVRFTEVPW